MGLWIISAYFIIWNFFVKIRNSNFAYVPYAKHFRLMRPQQIFKNDGQNRFEVTSAKFLRLNISLMT